MHKQKRRYFHAKTTGAKLYIHNGVGAKDLYIDEAHMALDIFRFVAFLKQIFLEFILTLYSKIDIIGFDSMEKVSMFKNL